MGVEEEAGEEGLFAEGAGVDGGEGVEGVEIVVLGGLSWVVEEGGGMEFRGG